LTEILHAYGKASILHLWPLALAALKVICIASGYMTDGERMKKLREFAVSYQQADPALAVTLKFVLAGIIWILFSDSILFFLGKDNIIWKLAHIHILKGLFFVGVTGAFLFFWTNRFVISLHRREAEVRQLFHSSPIAMGIIDAMSFKFLEVNQSLSALYNVSGKELRDISMSHLAVEEERFEAVPLLIKTGSRELGTWKFHKGDTTISVEMSVLPIREKKAFLVIFMDVTNQLRNERDLMAMKKLLEKQFNEKLTNLNHLNEELAYRASQTEHVNAELIAVNEQLQHVNKKISLRAEESFWRNDQIDGITGSLSEVLWAFDLTGRSKAFISASVAELYEAAQEDVIKPWFWLEYIHPDDVSIKEWSQQQLMESGASCCTYRIITAKGNIKTVVSKIKLLHDPKGIPMIMGSATDISGLHGEFIQRDSSKPSVKHV
jgi:PAS domain S-box-containing protein